MKKVYLITGARGFIGKHLSTYLKKVEPNSKIIKLPKKIDLLNSKQTLNFFKKINVKVDYIFHLADVSGNKKWASDNSFLQTYANVQIHLNTIFAWKKFLPKSKLVFVSSIWAYPIGKNFQNEKNYWEGKLIDYAKFYAYSKKIASLLLEAANNNFKLKSTTFILGTVFGPGDKSDHFIPSIIRRMNKNPLKLEIRGTGKESRDFIFIEDQIKAIYLHKDCNEALLNVGTGRLVNIKKIIIKLKKIMNFNGKIIFQKIKKDDKDIKRGMSVKKAIFLSGWPNKYNLTNIDIALKATVKDMRING
tara:strand:- start:7301 stop:8212 length:912 start_codon:yes stop_codon:yes gene_type:complete